MTQYTYQVIYDPANTAVNITDFVERLTWTEIGTGAVANSNFRLNGQDGQFITQETSLGGVSTPIIDEFDRIRIIATDREDVVFDKVYEVDNLKPTQNAQQGTVLEVECLGLEHHLQRTQFAKQFYFESAFAVGKGIADFYNSPDTSGTLQPIITKQDDTEFNTLPVWTANDYPFNVAEQKCYDGLTKLVDRVGSSVASGGAGDFWEFDFPMDFQDAQLNTIIFNAQISGNPVKQQDVNGDFDPATAVIIDDSVAVNPAEEEAGIESKRGTLVASWGASNFGALPPENATFAGALEAWPLYPAHIPGTKYPADAIVIDFDQKDTQGDFVHYETTATTTNAPPNAPWVQKFFTDFITDIGVVQYSLYTNARANEWKSSCANPDNNGQSDTNPTFDMRAIWDSNLVVVDGTVFRTWADIRAVNVDSIPSQYKRNGLFYRGFRILIDESIGTPVGELADFSNGDVVQAVSNDGVNNVWSVHRTLADQNECAIDDEGRVYQLQSSTLVDLSGSTAQANDCYHNVWAIYNSQGFNNKDNGAGGNFGEFSAVTHEFRYNNQDPNRGVSAEVKYYRVFAGIDFRIPYPHDSYNSNTIGELYGDNDKLDPATLDANNMHLTHDGKIGFNNTSSIDLGSIDAVAFALKMEWRYKLDGSGGLLARGNIPYRCVMYDTSDNVVAQDFTVSFNNLWESVSLPTTAFKIYRARAGWSFGSVGQNVFLQGLEVLNVFEFKNIVKISIQWLGPYDDQGRFTPFMRKNEVLFEFTDFLTSPLGVFEADYNVKLSIDNFRFAKPLLAVSPPDTSRSLQPDFFQEPLISNSFQLNQSNLAILEIMKFRHQQYEVTTEGTFDIDFADSFYLRNSFLVNASDNGANTILLVAKKITYTIDKPPTGVGGFLRHITGVKRIT